MKNKKIYSVLVSLIPAVQAMLDTFNLAQVNDTVRAYIGAVLILLLIVLQGIQIYLNPSIKDKALWVSVVALVGYIAGGIIDNLDLVHMTEEVSGIVRLIFSLVVTLANAIVRQYNTVDNNNYTLNLK